LVIEVLSEPSGLEVVLGLGRLDHKALGPRDLQADGPFGVLMVSPLIEDDPPIRSEVQVVQVMGMVLGQPATLQMT
jgi:hypothetical protein